MPQSDDTPPDVPPIILTMVKAARKIKTVSLVHLLLVTVVAMAASVGILYHRLDQKTVETPTGISGASPARSELPKQRKGIDIAAYCGWLGFDDGSFDPPPAQTPHCLSPITPQDLVELCRNEHRTEIKRFEFSNRNDAKTGKCIDIREAKIGGISGLSEFCLDRGAGWSQSAKAAPTPDGQEAAWRCRVDMDASVICAAQAGTQSVVARRTEESLECVPGSAKEAAN